MKIGFIGVGNMGSGMVGCLVDAGHEVTAFDRDPARLAALSALNLRAADTVAQAVSGAEAVITMLPNGAIVRKVYEDEILPRAGAGALLIDCSTIDLASARDIAAQAGTRGLAMLDAPVSGGVSGAAGGTLAFMVGGDADAFARARPLFDVMGAKAVHCGEAGTGQAVKLCNNMMLAIQMISVAEGFALAEKLNVAPQTLFDVSSAASGQCWSLTTYCPVAGVGPETSADRGFQPGFAAALMHKDLGLALEAATANGADPAFGRAALDAYTRMVEDGQGDLDFSAIINRIKGG